MNARISSWRWQGGGFRPDKEDMHARTAFVTAIMIALAVGFSLRAAGVKQLTMAEAVSLALKQNRIVKIARLQLQGNRENKANAKSLYFPTLKNESMLMHITELENIDIPAASFGTIPGVTALPPHDIIID
jgi:hypothetical protein